MPRPARLRSRLILAGLLALALAAVCAGPASAGRVKVRHLHGHHASHGAGAHSSGQVSTSPTQVVGEMSDSQAARHVQSHAEDRSDNTADDNNVPSSSQLAAMRSSDSSVPASYLARVDGDYKGTTDEIIQWAAYKWGFDPQLFRAVAAVETWWHMSFVGDGGNAYGLFQIDTRYHANQNLAANDTAFNADYYGAMLRSYYDGAQTWLNTVSGNGAPYRAHELWNSVGYWASGRWDVGSGQSYDSQVQSDLSQQVWLQPNFDGN